MAPLKDNSVTDEKTYHNRRAFIKQSLRLGVGLSFALKVPWSLAEGVEGGDFDLISQSKYGRDLELHSYKEITNYNNFYEFGTGKTDPADNSNKFMPRPWNLAVDGAVEKPGVYDLEDFLKPHQLEERVYWFRCVEAWSMVIPWVGIPLADVIKRMNPAGNAKYVAFETLKDAKRMPGQRRAVLDWPYREGLRMDEAMNPLSLLVVGLYGEVLPNQNGAPLRLVVPGWPASTAQKWLTRIELRDQVHDGPKMTGTSYRVPAYPVAPGQDVPDEDFVIIERMPVKSLVTFPANGADTGMGTQVRGHAWSGDRSIDKVEISTDFGSTWRDAELDAPVNDGAWQNWRADVTFPQAGYYEVWARATDSAGVMQPFAIDWNPKGYLNNTMHRVGVRAS